MPGGMRIAWTNGARRSRTFFVHLPHQENTVPMPFQFYRADNRPPEVIANGGFQAYMPLSAEAARQLVDRSLVDASTPMNLLSTPGNTIVDHLAGQGANPRLAGLTALYAEIRKETNSSTLHVSTSPQQSVGGFEHRDHLYKIECPQSKMHVWEINPSNKNAIAGSSRPVTSFEQVHVSTNALGLPPTKPVLITDTPDIASARMIAVSSPSGDGEVAFLTGVPSNWITETRSLRSGGPWQAMPASQGLGTPAVTNPAALTPAVSGPAVSAANPAAPAASHPQAQSQGSSPASLQPQSHATASSSQPSSSADTRSEPRQPPSYPPNPFAASSSQSSSSTAARSEPRQPPSYPPNPFATSSSSSQAAPARSSEHPYASGPGRQLYADAVEQLGRMNPAPAQTLAARERLAVDLTAAALSNTPPLRRIEDVAINNGKLFASERNSGAANYASIDLPAQMYSANRTATSAPQAPVAPSAPSQATPAPQAAATAAPAQTEGRMSVSQLRAMFDTPAQTPQPLQQSQQNQQNQESTPAQPGPGRSR